ncbi:MAG: hypothetical protein J7L52_03545 [Thermotogae bacterium]|nr:hypothetical protein [Thermotogota bacterium]
MKTFLAILGVIFLIYLAFKHFPLVIGIITLFMAGVVLTLIFLGLFTIALPLLLLGLLAALVGWLVKRLKGENV